MSYLSMKHEHYKIPSDSTAIIVEHPSEYYDQNNLLPFLEKLIQGDEIERAYAATNPFIFNRVETYSSFSTKTSFSSEDILAKHLLFDNSLLVYGELMRPKHLSFAYIKGLVRCNDYIDEYIPKTINDERRKEDILSRIGENIFLKIQEAEEKANGKDPYIVRNRKEQEEWSLKESYCRDFLRTSNHKLLNYSLDFLGDFSTNLNQIFEKEKRLIEKSKKLVNLNPEQFKSGFFGGSSSIRIIEFIIEKASEIKEHELLNKVVNFINLNFPGEDILAIKNYTVYFDDNYRKYILLDEKTAIKKYHEEKKEKQRWEREEAESYRRWASQFPNIYDNHF